MPPCVERASLAKKSDTFCEIELLGKQPYQPLEPLNIRLGLGQELPVLPYAL